MGVVSQISRCGFTCIQLLYHCILEQLDYGDENGRGRQIVHVNLSIATADRHHYMYTHKRDITKVTSIHGNRYPQ